MNKTIVGKAVDRQRAQVARTEATAVLAACVVSPDDRSPSERGEVGRNKTSGSTAYPAAQAKRDNSMPLKREQSEGVYGYVPQDPRAMVTATLPEPQPPALQAHGPRTTSDAGPPG